MNLQEITKAMEGLENWGLNGNAITKQFEFKDFREALEFVNKIGKTSEEHSHHPDITIRFNVVVLTLTTHSSGELTEKDFELAKAIDKLTTPNV
jgi:4a-hydroxytetrahydrobiopterin dehydratase